MRAQFGRQQQQQRRSNAGAGAGADDGDVGGCSVFVYSLLFAVAAQCANAPFRRMHMPLSEGGARTLATLVASVSVRVFSDPRILPSTGGS